MAGGGGSTGGIGAQSPAVNPPNPMGQIGDAVGGALGGMGGGQPQTPMGGGFGYATYGNGFGGTSMSGFGDNMLSNMGNNTRLGNNSQLGQLGNMANAAGVLTDFSMMQGGPHVGGGFGGSMGGQLTPLPSPNMPQPYMPDIDLYGGQPQNQFGQLGNMANIPQSEIGMPGGQGGQTQGGMGQQLLQQAQAMQQQGGMGQQPMGLAGLLGGMPNQPVPTAPPVSTTQPAPMAQPATVAARPTPVPTRAAPAKPSIMGSRPAAKPVAKPSVVPPKTPPAVASAIQKLAAKKQIRR